MISVITPAITATLSPVMAAYVVAVVIILSFLYIYHWKKNKNSPMVNIPFLGMLPQAFFNYSYIHDYTSYLLKKCGGTFEFRGPWFFNFGFVITSDPLNVHHILSKNFPNYQKGSDFKEILDGLGDGIFSSDGDDWKNQRAIIHSLLKNSRFLSFFIKTIQQKVENGLFPILGQLAEREAEFDMQDIFQRFTFDNISLMVLGVDPKCLSIDFPKVAYEKALDDLEEGVIRRHILPGALWKLQRWLNIGQERQYKKAFITFDDYLYQSVAMKRQQLEKIQEVKEDNFDLLTAYITEDLGKEGKSFQLTDKFLRDTAFNLMAAGRDTIGAGLSWLIWLVATHPTVEKKILEEIKENISVNEDGKRNFFSADEVSKLNYLHGAICEALRLYPPVPFQHKFAVEPDTLPSGFPIGRNTRVVISFYAMGRMESTWGKDCYEFKPERWVTDKGGLVHVPSYKFTAFNAGPRTCVGKEVSFVQMKMVAAAVIWNFNVEVVKGHHIFPSNSMVLHMEHGLKVRASKRKSF